MRILKPRLSIWSRRAAREQTDKKRDIPIFLTVFLESAWLRSVQKSDDKFQMCWRIPHSLTPSGLVVVAVILDIDNRIFSQG